jgi:hypothetical protein
MLVFLFSLVSAGMKFLRIKVKRREKDEKDEKEVKRWERKEIKRSKKMSP